MTKNLVKMQIAPIEGYEDFKPLTVQFNPNSISYSESRTYSGGQIDGKDGSPKPINYGGASPANVSFELLFDAEPHHRNRMSEAFRKEIDKLGVNAFISQIKALMKPAASGEKTPPKVMLAKGWFGDGGKDSGPGVDKMIGVITSLSVNYKQFNEKGVPTRCTANMSFLVSDGALKAVAHDKALKQKHKESGKLGYDNDADKKPEGAGIGAPPLYASPSSPAGSKKTNS